MYFRQYEVANTCCRKAERHKSNPILNKSGTHFTTAIRWCNFIKSRSYMHLNWQWPFTLQNSLLFSPQQVKTLLVEWVIHFYWVSLTLHRLPYMFSLGFCLKGDIFRDLKSKFDFFTSWQKDVRSLQRPQLQRSGKFRVYQIRLNSLLLKSQEILCSNYRQVASLWAA